MRRIELPVLCAKRERMMRKELPVLWENWRKEASRTVPETVNKVENYHRFEQFLTVLSSFSPPGYSLFLPKM